MSRYILNRCAEMYNIVISIDPKPIPGDWNGSGCHTNFSTEKMRRAPDGLKHILAGIGRLAEKHKEHIAAYGEGNERRLTGTAACATARTRPRPWIATACTACRPPRNGQH